MTTLPIPFLTAFLLVILASTSHYQLRETNTGRVFALFLYVNFVATLCIGFRWSHDLLVLLPIAAILAVISSGLLYLAFCSLGRAGRVIEPSRDWWHLAPALLILVALFIQPRWIEFLLVATKVVYAGLMIRLARSAPSSLQLVRLSWLSNSQKALWGAVVLLVLSIGVDIAINIDFALYDGRHAERLVGVANLVVVGLLGWASVMAGRGMGRDGQATNMPLSNDVPQPQTVTETDVESGSVSIDKTQDSVNVTEQVATQIDDSSEDDAQLLRQLNHLLIDQRMYADTELNLQKLARKVGVPARIVSGAINRHTDKNVSQWVNSARVDAVCELLRDENISVTQAMHTAGFLTKSNFNREFRRIKGCSPSQWRTDNTS